MSDLWTLDSIKVQGFRLLKDCSVTLGDCGLVYLGGENRDVPMASSNMSGKSTLLNAITWALYGCDANGIALSADVISNGDNKAFVILTFSKRYANEHGERCIASLAIIDRWRARSGSPISGIKFEIDGRVITDTAQSEINAVFGAQDVFLAAHIAGYDEAAIPFARQPDKAQKRLFDLLIDAEDLDRAFEKAQARVRHLREGVVAQEGNVARLLADVDAREHLVEEYDSQVALAKSNLQKAVVELSIAKKQRVVADAEIVVARGNLNVEESACEVLDTRILDEEQVLSTIRSQAKSEVSRLSKLRAVLDQGQGAECPVCKTGLSGDRLKTVASDFDCRIQAHKGKLDMTPTESPIRTSDEYGQVLEALRNARGYYQTIERTLRHASSEEDRAMYAMHNAKQASDSIVQTVQGQEDEILKLEGSLLDSQESLVILQDDLCKYEFWVEGFGPRGIRAFRLDEITPVLNNLALRYSDCLFGDGTRAQYSTLTPLKGGGFREKFDLSLYDEKGERLTVLSAGQSMRRDIVHAFSVSDLAQQLGKRTVSMLVLDEIFRTLDAAGIEQAMQLLDEKSVENSMVMVIEHSPELEAHFDTSLYGVRENDSTKFEWR